MTSPTDWPPDRVKQALYDKGLTLVDVARRHGYQQSAASAAVHRKPWPTVKRLIAEAIGVPPQEIWPSVFDERGQVRRNLFGRRRGFRRKASTSPAAGNVRSSRAA